jgi:Fur family transcriptional regulator, ferric uptake regulator
VTEPQASGDVAIERILARLKDDGGRITTPRVEIVKILLASDEHLSADDIAERVQAAHPSVATSTVYRTLETLEQLGVIDHVHVAHGRAHYHLAERDPHQHLACTVCGAIIEAPAALLDDVAARVRRELGFELEAHHSALIGRCRECVATDARSSGA